MVNHYKLIYFILFESFTKIISFKIYPMNDKNILISKHQLMSPPDYGEPKDKDKQGPGGRDDNFKEYEDLLNKQKETEELYKREKYKLSDLENQLKIDKIHICLLIIIVCILAILLIVYICYELYKYRKRNLLRIGDSINKTSFGKEFKSSFESSNSTNESNKKKSSFNQSQNADLDASSNYNIFLNNE